MDILLVLVAALALSFGLSELVYRLKYPKVIGQILAGIIIGLPLIREFLFKGATSDFIELLAELGIVFLMLLVGLEADYQKMRGLSRVSSLLAVFSVIFSFVFGAVLIGLLGYGVLVALVVGAALSISAEPITAKLLIELKKLKTRVGEVLIGAGILDDIIGMFFLSIVLIIINSKNISEVLLFPLEAVIFVGIMFVLFKLVSKAMVFLEKEPTDSFFSILVVLALAIAYLSEFLGVGIVIGAFAAGIILQISIKNSELEKKMVSDLKDIAFALFVPFFFITIGLNFDLGSLKVNWLLFGLILIVAIVGKLLGAYALKPVFPKISWNSLTLLGMGMNSRGILGLIVALIALRAGILPTEIFSAIVGASVITGILFGVAAKHYSKKPSVWGLSGL